jgi:hypothetical protein
MGQDPQPNSSSAPPSAKRLERLAFTIPQLQCMRCGDIVHTEACNFHHAVQIRYVVASCCRAGCKMQGIRLKVPVRTIECEVL